MGKLKNIVIGAVAGNKNSLAIIIKMYAPIIKSESIVDGRFNEDLAQEIILSILDEMHNFEIRDLGNNTNF